jgi:hypothetical protein
MIYFTAHSERAQGRGRQSPGTSQHHWITMNPLCTGALRTALPTTNPIDCHVNLNGQTPVPGKWSGRHPEANPNSSALRPIRRRSVRDRRVGRNAHCKDGPDGLSPNAIQQRGGWQPNPGAATDPGFYGRFHPVIPLITYCESVTTATRHGCFKASSP